MEEDFETPENATDVMEILINNEIRTFRYVTDLKQNGSMVTPEKIILDGTPREFEFYSIVKIDKKRAPEYIKTHTRCFGVMVVIDNLVEVGEDEEDEDKDSLGILYE